MKRVFFGAVFFILIFFITNISFAQNVFDNKTTASAAANYIPRLKSANCKFSQIKKIPNVSPIKSSGNFQFIEDKGVIFETTYPVKSITTYTNEQNKKINDIILSLSKGNYKFLDNNFDIYFIKNQIWTLALKPKPSNNASKQLCNIIIKGNASYIEQITFNTKNGQTDIYFECKK